MADSLTVLTVVLVSLVCAALLARDKGQGLVEYALILALVATVVIGIVMLLGPAIGNIFSQIVGAI